MNVYKEFKGWFWDRGHFLGITGVSMVLVSQYWSAITPEQGYYYSIPPYNLLGLAGLCLILAWFMMVIGVGEMA